MLAYKLAPARIDVHSDVSELYSMDCVPAPTSLRILKDTSNCRDTGYI